MRYFDHDFYLAVARLVRIGFFAALTPFIAFVSVLSFDSNAFAVPAQWRTEDGGNGFYYERVVQPGGSTWTEANADAASRSWLNQPGHLVTINSQAEWNFVVATFPTDWTWIGLTDEGSEGSFGWVTGEPVAFTRWIPGEPNDAGNEDFVFYQRSSGLGGDWGWNDFRNFRDVFSSSLPIGYIVEYEVVPEPASIVLAIPALAAMGVFIRRRAGLRTPIANLG